MPETSSFFEFFQTYSAKVFRAPFEETKIFRVTVCTLIASFESCLLHVVGCVCVKIVDVCVSVFICLYLCVCLAFCTSSGVAGKVASQHRPSSWVRRVRVCAPVSHRQKANSSIRTHKPALTYPPLPLIKHRTDCDCDSNSNRDGHSDSIRVRELVNVST